MSKGANGENVFSTFPVLLVDDDETFLNSMYMTLKSEGITNVERCKDSREVIPLLKEKRYSLILLDILMPHARGDALLPQILEEQPGIKVIMITAVDEVETAVECMSVGALYYLVKPVEASELIKKVKDALNASFTGKTIFISYSHRDKEFANRLVKDLNNEGMRVWIDKKKIKVGESISKKVEEGISQCDFFCFILSQHSVKSKWVEREYRAALSEQLRTGRTPHILPLLIQDVQLPLLLQDICCADFFSDYSIGLSNLIDAIKSGNPNIKT